MFIFFRLEKQEPKMFHLTLLMISMSLVCGAPYGTERENENLKYVIKRLFEKELSHPTSGRSPVTPVGQPGDGPYRMGHMGLSKRNEEFPNSPKSCEDAEWFVLVNDMPACGKLWQLVVSCGTLW